ILSFTSEESWGFLPRKADQDASIFLNDYPTDFASWRNEKLEEIFAPIWETRAVVLKALEEARQAKTIGHPREALLELTVDSARQAALRATKEELSRLFLVSEIQIKTGEGVQAAISRATGEKCARCWTYARTVGKNQKHPDLCDRCVEAIG
ncbi:MAG: zinc finger domain-containing protein, partial [Bdellovibrionota bacterium]